METDTRQSFYEKMDAQLKDWGIDLERMSARAGEEYAKTVELLREKRIVLKARLTELKESKGPAWESMKEGFEKSWGELRKGMEEAYRKLK